MSELIKELKEQYLMLLHFLGLAIAMIFSAVSMVLYIGDVISGLTFAEGMVVAILGLKGSFLAYEQATNYI
jgi:hypothetical protein